MTCSFRVYIDESGDEGFTFLDNERGSSRWLVLSALVMRQKNDTEAVVTARKARELLNKPPKHALHFRELKHEQRVPLARLIGAMSTRTVSVLIHKPSIPEQKFFSKINTRSIDMPLDCYWKEFHGFAVITAGQMKVMDLRN